MDTTVSITELIATATAVSVLVGGVVGWLTSAWKTASERGKTRAEEQKIIGEAWSGVVLGLRQTIEDQAKAIDELEAHVDRLRAESEAHASERVTWLAREREMETRISELQRTLAQEMERAQAREDQHSAELEALREHARHLAERLAARDRALDLERRLRDGESEADASEGADDARST